ncbi:MAG: sulfatase [Planctomycetes bacterium]|nr:sulfatase [Planctomycetota bacterium]
MSAGPIPAAEQATTPNVVLLLADDLGYSDVGCFGATGIKTPNLDRMAAEGRRFTSFYVAQAVCTASRAALMSGCYPNRVGLQGALNHTSTVGISDAELLLPEIFRARGYATACFGKWHLGQQRQFLPLRQGFDEFLGLPYSNDNGPLHPVVRDIPALPWIDGESVVEHDPDQSQFTRRLTERAVAFIEKNKDRPFFLYVPHIMPHVPIFASEKFRGTSGLGLYGDVVQELDWSVGEILTAIRQQGLDERTLVIFASDNGPFLSYGSHAGTARPLREGKLTTFEGGIRVPCIMRWTGRIPAGNTCDELVSTLDLFPSLARLIGGELASKPIDGIDASAVLTGPAGATSPRQTFYYYSGDELHAVRAGNWKLHVPHDYLVVDGEPRTDGKPANFGRAQPLSITISGIRGIASRHGYKVEQIGLSLYNLQDDIGETKNVADSHPDVVERLLKLIETARDDLGDSITGRAGKNLRPAGKASAVGPAL